eukprot:2397313-Rhodomonas_salina.6
MWHAASWSIRAVSRPANAAPSSKNPTPAHGRSQHRHCIVTAYVSAGDYTVKDYDLGVGIAW